MAKPKQKKTHPGEGRCLGFNRRRGHARHAPLLLFLPNPGASIYGKKTIPLYSLLNLAKHDMGQPLMQVAQHLDEALLLHPSAGPWLLNRRT